MDTLQRENDRFSTTKRKWKRRDFLKAAAGLFIGGTLLGTGLGLRERESIPRTVKLKEYVVKIGNESEQVVELDYSKLISDGLARELLPAEGKGFIIEGNGKPLTIDCSGLEGFEIRLKPNILQKASLSNVPLSDYQTEKGYGSALVGLILHNANIVNPNHDRPLTFSFHGDRVIQCIGPDNPNIKLEGIAIHHSVDEWKSLPLTTRSALAFEDCNSELRNIKIVVQTPDETLIQPEDGQGRIDVVARFPRGIIINNTQGNTIEVTLNDISSKNQPWDGIVITGPAKVIANNLDITQDHKYWNSGATIAHVHATDDSTFSVSNVHGFAGKGIWSSPDIAVDSQGNGQIVRTEVSDSVLKPMQWAVAVERGSTFDASNFHIDVEKGSAEVILAQDLFTKSPSELSTLYGLFDFKLDSTITMHGTQIKLGPEIHWNDDTVLIAYSLIFQSNSDLSIGETLQDKFPSLGDITVLDQSQKILTKTSLYLLFQSLTQQEKNIAAHTHSLELPIRGVTKIVYSPTRKQFGVYVIYDKRTPIFVWL